MKLVSCFCVAFFILSCSSTTQQLDRKPIDLIPASSFLILQSEDLPNLSSVLMGNSFLKANKNLPFLHQVANKVDFYNFFETSTHGLLCFSAVGKKDIATTFVASSEDIDFQYLKEGIAKKTSFTYEGNEITELIWKEQSVYAVWFDDVIFVSDSKLIVENKIRDYENTLPTDEAFAKVLKTVDASTPSLFLNLEKFRKIYSQGFDEETYSSFSNLTDWLALDLKIGEDKLQLSGVAISDLSKNRKLSLLADQQRITPEIAKLVPLNAIGFESYGITNFEVYLAQRKKQGLTGQTPYTAFYNKLVEIGKIHTKKEDVVVLRSSKPEETFASLNKLSTQKKTFRGFQIVELNKADLLQIYAPLIALGGANFLCQIEDFFVVAATVEALENIIITYVNDLNLQSQNSYQKQIAQLSSSSSALFYGLTENWKEAMKSKSKPNFEPNLRNLALTNYKGVAIQINVDKAYAYLNLIFQQAEMAKDNRSVKQKDRFKLDFESLIQPRLFTNWRTKQRDVFVQDQNLVAHLYDSEGKTLWSKKMKDVINGDFVEFDIYKNTRLQMAFATSNSVFVVDKNGNDVSPFPVQFIEKITQPLQLFDYDKNGNYRFMLCFGNSLKAFDKGGNLVKGFSFNTKGTPISSPPKHFRIGNKDYIVVQDASAKVYILDRRGQVRVPYQTEVEFSGEPWFVHDGKFTSTTANGDLVQISENGKVEVTPKELSRGHSLVANERLLVTLSENKLQINEVQIELDYGMYTQPQIIKTKDKTWVSLTDLQAKKLYVFDEFGSLLNGFPVFGSSRVDYFSTDASKVQLMLKGEENSILFYEIK